MAISVVRCPFCERRYNVTGIPSGTKVLCTACGAILTVPLAKRPTPPAWWRRWLPETSSGQVTLGLVGGLLLASVAYLFVKTEHAAPAETAEPSASAAVSPAPAAAKSVSQGPLAVFPKREEPPLFLPRRDEQVRQFMEHIYDEFGLDRFQFDVRPKSSFVLAVEKRRGVPLVAMCDEFQGALGSLRARFGREFGEPLGLADVDEILKVVVFTRRETFDECLRRTNNQPLPPEISGLYQYVKRRVEFYHDQKGYPIEVLLHEAVHQLVHYYFRQRAEPSARPSWWFQEGVATYFEQYTFSPTGHIVVDPSLVSPRVAAIQAALRQDELPRLYQLMGMDIDDVWKINQSSATVDEQEKTMRFIQLCYGQAWALVHYLRHGAGGQYRPLFEEYFRRELQGRGGKDEFIRLLSERHNKELAQLQIELERYLATLPDPKAGK